MKFLSLLLLVPSTMAFVPSPNNLQAISSMILNLEKGDSVSNDNPTSMSSKEKMIEEHVIDERIQQEFEAITPEEILQTGKKTDEEVVASKETKPTTTATSKDEDEEKPKDRIFDPLSLWTAHSSSF